MKFLSAIALTLFLTVNVLATDVTIGATSQPNFNPTGLATAATVSNVTIVNGTNALLTCAACFRPQWVGMGGFYITVGVQNYYVKNVDNTSQVTLTSSCPETTPATVTWHPYVEFRVYADRAFQPLGESYIVQPGTPGTGSWYKRYGASVITVSGVKTLYIPELVIDATTDAIGPTNQARYTAAFYRPDNSLIQIYSCADQFRVPPVTPTSWGALCQFNSPPAIVPPANEAYTKTQIDARLITCTTSQMVYYAATGNQPSCLNVGTGLTITAGALLTIGGTQQSINVVTDYGCDPTDNGGTADQTCLQSAINAAAASGGKTVYVPTGVYNVSGISIPGGVTVMGDGRNRSIIKSSTNATIVSLTEGTGSYEFFGPSVRSIGITGSVTAGSSQTGLLITDNLYFFNVQVSTIDVLNTGGIGVSIGNAYSSMFADLYIDNAAGFPFNYDAVNMPQNVFDKIYIGNIRASAPVAFRIKGGEFTCRGCNGVNNVLAGSSWAVVGKSVADGGANGAAKFTCIDCNMEDWTAYGVRSYYGSTVTLKGQTKIQMNASGSGTGIPVYFDMTGNGTTYYSEILMRGYIEDTIQFTQPATMYPQNEPVHAQGVPPLQVIGAGPEIVTAGVPARVATFYNTTTSGTGYLARVDGYGKKITVTGTTTLSGPYGVRYVEANCSAACIITLPWAGWYQVADTITVKDISGNASTNNITITSASGGTVNGSTYAIQVSNGAVILRPNDGGSGDWRIVSEYRSGPQVLTLADGSTSSLGIQRLGDTDTGAYLTASGFFFAKDGAEYARLSPNDNQIKGVLRFSSSGTGANYITFPNEDTYFQFNNSTKWIWSATGQQFPATSDTSDVGLLGNELRSVRAATSLQAGISGTKTGELIFRNASNSFTTTVKGGTTGSDATFTLPATVPAGNDYLLKSSTAGVMDWTTVTGTGNAVLATSPTITSPILNNTTSDSLSGSATNGTVIICTNCKPNATTGICEGSGNGSLAMRISGAWKCN